MIITNLKSETIDNAILSKAIQDYRESVKKIIPIEERVKELKNKGLSYEEIKKILGKDSYVLTYVPKYLYHASPEELNIIKAHESIQKGKYVYATDNPILAVFFSIFKNRCYARGTIIEHIDKKGKYSAKYIIDERIENALKKIISNYDITIHICKGHLFFHSVGEAYTEREWLSKGGRDILPIGKIKININEFFSCLEKNNLIEYNKYDKRKDFETVIDLLLFNYTLGLATDKAQNRVEYEKTYDCFIKRYFKEQFEFSKVFRAYIRMIMNEPIRTDESKEYNRRLRIIKNVAATLLKEYKEQNKIIILPNEDNITSFVTKISAKEQERNEIYVKSLKKDWLVCNQSF